MLKAIDITQSMLQRTIDHELNYNQNCQKWKTQPVYQRKRQNQNCMYIFIGILLLFVGISGYYMATKKQVHPKSFNFFTEEIVQWVLVIVITVIIALVFVLLIIAFTDFIVKWATWIIALFSGIMIYVSVKITSYTGIFLFSFAVLCVLLYYIVFRKLINIATVVVKVACKCIKQKKILFLSILIKVMLAAGIILFWMYIFSLMLNQNYRQIKQQSHANTISILILFVWFFLSWFFLNFLYYITCFTTTTICSFWYYRITDKNPISISYKHIISSSIGSITYCSLMIPILKWIQLLTEDQMGLNNNGYTNSDNVGCIRICMCCLKCCFKKVAEVVAYMNCYCISMMAITGEGFVDSAKTVFGAFQKDQLLYSLVDKFMGIFTLWSLSLSVVIPCVIGGYIIPGQRNDEGKEDSFYNALMWGLILISFTFTYIVNSVLFDTINSVTIFYCMDKRFKEMEYNGNNMPAEEITSVLDVMKS